MTKEYVDIKGIENLGISRQWFYELIKNHEVEKLWNGRKRLFLKDDLIEIFKNRDMALYYNLINIEGIELDDKNWTKS